MSSKKTSNLRPLKGREGNTCPTCAWHVYTCAAFLCTRKRYKRDTTKQWCGDNDCTPADARPTNLHYLDSLDWTCVQCTEPCECRWVADRCARKDCQGWRVETSFSCELEGCQFETAKPENVHWNPVGPWLCEFHVKSRKEVGEGDTRKGKGREGGSGGGSRHSGYVCRKSV
jgi:hypothetical protein